MAEPQDLRQRLAAARDIADDGAVAWRPGEVCGRVLDKPDERVAAREQGSVAEILLGNLPNSLALAPSFRDRVMHFNPAPFPISLALVWREPRAANRRGALRMISLSRSQIKGRGRVIRDYAIGAVA